MPSGKGRDPKARMKRVAKDVLPPSAYKQLHTAYSRIQPSSVTRGKSYWDAARLLRSDSVDQAASAIGRTLDRRPKDPATLRLASQIEVRRGDFASGSAYAQRGAAASRDPQDQSRARKLLGRVRETDPLWRPRVVGPPPDRPTSTRALYIAKESRPFLSNGFCTRTHETLAGLQNSGRDVVGVTMPGFPSVIGVENAPSRSVVEGVAYDHVLPDAGAALGELGFDEYLQVATQVMAAEVARLQPDLLHVGSGHRGYDTALIGSAVAEWAGIPWVYEVRSFFETTWTPDPRYMESAPYYHRRFDTETRMMHLADAVVTLSGPMREEIIERHGVPRDRVFVIPNAVDTDRFTPQERDAALRTTLGLGHGFTLGYVSNISHPREGQEILIDAVARLVKQGHDINCLLVGDGSRLDEMKALARSRGVADRIVFTGSVPFDQVADYYAQIDLFVVPRIDERAGRMVSPMKPFEAMAMRVPLLMSDLPALAEIADHDRLAHTFKAGDAGDLARVALALRDAPHERLRLVDEAEKWVRTERTWARAADAFGAVYDDLRARSRQAAG
jgi:phosphatidylinositol alpha-1,6-mannosyltransferase